jgi:chondroitin 4-sulfotransferase 11
MFYINHTPDVDGATEEKTLFLHIPKTAGKSVLKWARDNIPLVVVMPKVHPHDTGDNQEADFTWCIVRNTYEKVVSTYHFLIRLSFLPEETTFAEFVEMISTTDKYNEWFKPQQEYTKNCDLVLNYETLEEDFVQIQTRYGVDAPLEIVNKSTSTTPWREYYTDEIAAQIQAKFQTEIETFGYTLPEN